MVLFEEEGLLNIPIVLKSAPWRYCDLLPSRSWPGCVNVSYVGTKGARKRGGGVVIIIFLLVKFAELRGQFGGVIAEFHIC